jgi:hypothetical protein
MLWQQHKVRLEPAARAGYIPVHNQQYKRAHPQPLQQQKQQLKQQQGHHHQ